jgi:S-disulfanyl-L-cysteine oxidoreductase SoxD
MSFSRSLRPITLASFLFAVGGCATTSSTPAATGPSAAAPASFAEQVAAGQTLYAQSCASCHGDSGQGTAKAPRVVGIKEGALPLDPPAERQFRKSQFVTVADVAKFTVENMPPKKAGTLTNDQYLAILAFDLKANGIDLPSPLTLEMAPTLTIPR